ncbi:MAG: signal peptidase I [Candidatus Spechtbacterales bacterium]
MKGPFLFFWDIAKIVIISLAIIVPIRYFIMQPFFVRGASMHPTFESGDYLIINEIGYRFSAPQRGDVVVFRPPQDNTRQFYIKRIIGLPGETVKVEGGKILVGKDENSFGELAEEYIKELTPGSKTVKLGNEEYFVLGDNRNSSSDSRVWGALKREAIIGRAWIRAWPIGEFGLVKGPNY